METTVRIGRLIIGFGFAFFLLLIAADQADAETITGYGDKCLDIQGGQGIDGAVVQIYSCHGGANQQWILTDSGEIRGDGSKCLDVPWGIPIDGVVLQVFTCHGGENQKWRFTEQGELRGIGDKCVDIRGGDTIDGTPVQLFTCHGGENQKWGFNSISALALKTAMVWIPGYREPQAISYREVIDGYYLIEGDVLVDPTWTPARKYANASAEVQEGIGTSQQGLSSIETAHLWPVGIIPYAISDEFSDSQCRIIEQNVQALDAQTDLTFVPRIEDPDYIDFRTNEEGCYTSTGWHGGRHRIFLAPDCLATRVIKHETLHAAGFHHEQIREDRDNFVTILWDNILSDKTHNFELKTGETFNQTPYDYGSIMHYFSTAFGKTDANGNTLQTIFPKQPGVTAASLGGNDVSSQDITGINQAYSAVIPNDPLLQSSRLLSLIETTYDRCRQTSFTIGDQFIPKGDTIGKVITLQNNRFSWWCGSTQEWTTCREGTTHVKASRDSGGRIQWDCITNAPEPGARFLNTEIDRCGDDELEIQTTSGRQNILNQTATWVEVPDRQITWWCGGTTERATLPSGSRFVRVYWDRNDNRRIEWHSYTKGITSACN